LTTEEQLEEIEESQGADKIRDLKKQIKNCENQILETEGNRLQAEKENVELLEIIHKLRKELAEKQAKLDKLYPKINYESVFSTISKK